ncbi:MAG: PKD domain-containing protein [Dehalococcoidia bacterium]|jgi:PKD repeat protein
MRTKIVSLFLLVALVVTPLVACSTGVPTADFSYTPAAPTTDDAILFSDSSTDSDGSLIAWDWDFGDGTTATTQNPTHSYSAAGSYVVALTVTDDSGATDTKVVNLTVAAGAPGIGKWDAIEILVKEIIPPAAGEDRISAFMLSEPLLSGDTISSDSGQDYPVNTKTWFIFIDDNPEAFYAHATRYVFINASDGSYTISNESWPPDINGYSMWDPQLGKGHLLELWSVLDIPMPLTAVASTAPEADYGDAPDGQDAYYGVVGHFPTLFATTNSLLGRPGVHTLNVGEETLGLRVSAEVDALDPNDPDGRPNLVDADKDERMYVITEEDEARLAFTVSVSLGAPDLTRYANALIDFDYSGNWSESSYGEEWVTVNLAVDVDPGDSETVMTPLFDWNGPAVSPTAGWTTGVWMRVSLTREQVDESLFANEGGWDGSGEFTYGEIEDHFIILSDVPALPTTAYHWPPPPGGNGNGNGNGGGGEPPPGSETGPCGYQINYLVLIINCGDKYSHLARGLNIAQQASSSMSQVTQDQGYTPAGNLSPSGSGDSQTSVSNIGQAIADLAAQAKCGDHVLIYICGHGGKKSSSSPEGGISIYNSSGGKTGEKLTPSDLAGFLGSFQNCDGEDCGTPGCCHVSVIIESCYAGNFNVPGLNDMDNIKVAGSSSNTPAQGCMPGGGVYTAGYVSDSKDAGADQSDPPNGVDPMEAHSSASDAVSQNNSRSGKSQQPWSSGDWCECKCPCSPDIDVEKWVWDDSMGMWGTATEANLGDAVAFRLEIENTGVCRNILDLEIVDVMDDCLQFADESILFYNGLPIGNLPPDAISAVDGGTQLSWSLPESEIGQMEPGDVIAIEYYAYATEPGPNLNTVFASAHCSYTYTNIVTDQDTVTVWVEQEEIEPETVLHGYLEVGAQCYCEGSICVYCDVTASFEVTDLTVGDYPITNVALYMNGIKVFDSGPINSTYYANSFPLPEAGCGATYNFQLVATNSIGLQVEPTQPITTPSECQ